MKYVAIVVLILGLLCIAFGFRTSRLQTAAPDTDTEGARTMVVVERFCRLAGVGIVAVAVGFYLLDRARAGRAWIHGSAALALSCPRFCAKCGKPLHKHECGRGKQFGFIPRRNCPVCGSYVEQSGARMFALGFTLLGGGILGAFVLQGVPEFLLAASMISAPIGLILFILGAVVMDRQFRGVKNHAAATAARQPGLN